MNSEELPPLLSKEEREAANRRTELWELVRSAYNNAVRMTLVLINETGQYETLEQLEQKKTQAREIQEILSQLKDDSKFMITSKIEVKPHEAVTYHSHEYPQLLEIALEQLGLSNEVKKSTIKEYLEHEYAHAAVIMGEPGVKEIAYGIRFIKNTTTGNIHPQPFIYFEGQIPFLRYQEMTRAPRDLSEGDKLDLLPPLID